MKKKLLIVFGVLLIALTVASCKYTDTEKYVVEINNQKVSTAEFKFMLENVKLAMTNTGITDFEKVIDGVKQIDVAKDQTIENILSYKLGSQEAKKQNIKLEDEEISRINEEIDRIVNENASLNEILKEAELGLEEFKKINYELMLAQKLIDELIVNKEFSESEINEYYSNNIQEFTFEDENVRARHILLKTHDRNENGELVALSKDVQDEALSKANEALRRAKSGESFEKLVTEYSEDDGSKNNGGEYTFGKGEMVEAFENAAFSLKPGQISDLVKTEYGYHIIKVEEKYQVGQSKGIELVKAQIINEMQYEEYNRLISEWKKNAVITKNEKEYNSIS